ncbi:MAG TPA: cytochrome c oxidase assembly protein [Rhodanobacteraceae bacterium]|nr:cytochrome c oxidase assembly protein [Rhodanobacteraceae bacterium]
MNLLYWLAPWEFSPTVIVATGAAALLYLRGARLRPPGFWRQLSFWIGLALIYAALHTRFDYYAQREFFMHRLQHLALHHLGPFLIMLAVPGMTLRAGLPLAWRTRVVQPLLRSVPVQFVLHWLLNPVVAALLFFGIIYFWLWPSLHFVAMLDWRLYRTMNWSVTIDGLLFWWLVLDRRPKPPARLAPGVRVLVALAVALPQILLGAYIVFARHDLYPIYDLCGRAFAQMSSMTSQRIGGVILWIPGAMMSVIAALVALAHWTSLSSRHRLPRRVRAR